MHCFCHLSNVYEVFFHLEKIEWHFHAFEINDKLTEFQKPKYGNILQKLLLLLTNQTSNTQHVYNKIWTFVNKQVLVLNMLAFYGHDVLPHNTPKACNSTFLPPCVFCRLCFNTKFFSLPLISLHVLQQIKVNAKMSGTIFGFFERK